MIEKTLKNFTFLPKTMKSELKSNQETQKLLNSLIFVYYNRNAKIKDIRYL